MAEPSLWTRTGLVRAATSTPKMPGYNGWNKYGVLFAVWTVGLSVGGIAVMKIFGPKQELMDTVKLRDPHKQIGDGHRPMKKASRPD